MDEAWLEGYREGWRDATNACDRTARKVVSFGHDTEGTTGHCECSACHDAIDYWDAFCRHCGARLEG